MPYNRLHRIHWAVFLDSSYHFWQPSTQNRNNISVLRGSAGPDEIESGILTFEGTQRHTASTGYYLSVANGLEYPVDAIRSIQRIGRYSHQFYY